MANLDEARALSCLTFSFPAGISGYGAEMDGKAKLWYPDSPPYLTLKGPQISAQPLPTPTPSTPKPVTTIVSSGNPQYCHQGCGQRSLGLMGVMGMSG